jgi:opacity protein-like surface antigen
MIKRIALAAALAVALVAPAAAQDQFNWTGLYLGAHVGHGTGDHKGTGLYSDNSDDYKVLDPETGKVPLEGTLGGLQAGLNVQAGRFVYGIEGDFSWTGVGGHKTFISDWDNANQTNTGGDGTTDYTWKIKTDLEWLATLRGRLGVLVVDNLLIYGTGGAAFAKAGSHETVTGFPPQRFNPPETTVLASSSENLFGWVAGAGAEWALTERWSLKAEWQYIRFDNVDSHFKGTAYPNSPAPIAGYNNDSFPGDITLQTWRMGLNFKLN